MSDIGVIRAEGYNGQIEFDGETVFITHEGLKGKLGHGGAARSFRAVDVLRVDFREPTLLLNGNMTFVVPGMAPVRGAPDHNEVVFLKKQRAEFSAIRDAVEAILEKRGELSSERIAELEHQAIEEMKSVLEPLTFASYGPHRVQNGIYSYVADNAFRTIEKPVSGAVAVFDLGSDSSRPTLTRIGAGAVLAGPVGAVAGAMFKKDTSKCYVTVVFSDGDTVIIEGPAKHEKRLRQFAAEVTKRGLAD